MPRAGHVDMTGMGQAVSKTREFRKAARDEVKKTVDKARLQLEQEFAAHPVTQEIDGGANSENISNTLGGVGSNANLFSFIGFEQGERPTSIVKRAIRENTQVGLVITKPTGKGGTEASADVRVTYPTARDLRPYTSMPWESGKSWLEGVESGISGFSEYLHKKFMKGRSKFALQSKHRIRQSSFRPVPYFSEMINRFIKRLTGKNP